jgi:hypothetical protein
VGEAKDKESDGWRKGIDFGDWQEDEEGLNGSTKEEEGAEGEVAVECLLKD